MINKEKIGILAIMFKLILFTLLLATPASSFFGNGLTDINNYPWRNSIEYLQQQNIVEGYNDNTYQPSKLINRAEFTKIVVGAVFSESDITNTANNCFPDVMSQWFAPYVCLAQLEGIVNGYPDGLFHPEENINQAEALKIIFETFYTDIPPSTVWYQTYLDEALYQGMGYFEPNRAPEHLVTRGEMAYFIAWLLNENGTDQIDILADRIAFNVKQMTAADCYENEYFDANDQLCYLQKSNDNLVIENWNNQPHNHEPAYDENRYIRYKVNGNSIEFYEDKSEFAPELNNAAIHTAIWQTFTTLVPVQYRNNIDYFDVMISAEGTAAHVEPVTNTLDSWTLAIDINEFSLPGSNDEYKEFVATLVHELAHILSLNNTQIDGSVEDATECRPSFYIEEGCALANSIIQAYYHQFWSKELNSIYKNSYNPNDFGESLYANYPQHFITEYAASNPVEDLAEHFAYFVIQGQPNNNKDKIDQKLLFFYQFQPMVDLRNRIRQVLETQL